MDAGCQYRDYSSDVNFILNDFLNDLLIKYLNQITRTWPVNGRFNSAQRELYDACLNVQKHCLEYCTAGITLQKLYNIMMIKMSFELSELGLIEKKDHEVAVSIADKNSNRYFIFK